MDEIYTLPPPAADSKVESKVRSKVKSHLKLRLIARLFFIVCVLKIISGVPELFRYLTFLPGSTGLRRRDQLGGGLEGGWEGWRVMRKRDLE